MKLIFIFMLFSIQLFSQTIPVESTLSTDQKELLSKMTKGYEKSSGRLMGSLYTYPVYMDPDGNTFTLKVLSNRIKLIPVEMFYGVVSR